MLAAKLLAASGGVDKLYVDDVFSAYTYTGNGSTQTITNGIDLAGKGGLVWTKDRSVGYDNCLIDTAIGTSKYLRTNNTGAAVSDATEVTGFTSTGYTLGSSSNLVANNSGTTYVSWTFRNADKFYNHTTVTKTAGSNATVSFANLTTLGMVRVKRTDSTGSWYIWHRSLTAGKLLIGETTAAEATLGHITVSGTTVTLVNGTIADGTYLVEGFAHDTGPDGLIQCGGYAGSNVSNVQINTGWEQQFVLIKNITSPADWYIFDTSRGVTIDAGGNMALLANSSGAEAAWSNGYISNANAGLILKPGWSQFNANTYNYVYIAIRRPNKPPTTGTQVYNAIARTGTGAAATVTGVGFAPDHTIIQSRAGAAPRWGDRLRGAAAVLRSTLTNAELTTEADLTSFNMDGVTLTGTGASLSNASATDYINHFFKRAPGVLSQICYSGTGANKTESHDLGVAPELWLVKGRSGATQWVWGSSLLANTEKIVMPTPAGKVTDATAWNSTYPTSTVLSLGTAAAVNTSAATYTAYLWATLAGVSKVFAYIGDGTSGKVINCGFTTGARFVMIVRTSAAGSVFIWDTARGIVAGNDPHLCLDTTAAEVTTDDSIDPDTSGFAINQVAATNINVNGATYIGLAYS